MHLFTFLLLLIKFCNANNITVSKNETLNITQPLAASQQIIQTIKGTNFSSEFRPSPVLDLNPIPESKSFNFGEMPLQQWPFEGYKESTKIKFPTSAPKDRPYQFYEDKTRAEEYYYENEKKKQLVERNKFDFSAPVHTSSQKYDYGISSEKTDGTLGYSHHQHVENPWKRVAKLLAAAIPIGLLISALTPSIITIQNVNGTYLRSRSVDSPKPIVMNSRCEDRILCELILSASLSQNAEYHVDNLLNNFTEERKAVEKAEEMRKILAAVKQQDCRPIVCDGVKEKIT